MLKLGKTALLGSALIALTTHSASAQFSSGRLPQCERNGGHTVNGKGESPAQQAAPPAAAAQQPAPPPAPAPDQQSGGRAGGRQGGGQPAQADTAQQDQGRGTRGQA